MCNYAVVDLEMCKVPYGARKGKIHLTNETIQIGAVLLNEELEIVDKFVTYVSPEYGFIDTYINKLTGIGRNDVSNAPTIEVALNAFVKWLPRETKVVSWSNNDKLQIKHEVESKGIQISELEEILETWIDCQKTFADKMHNQRCYRLSEALVAADIDYEDGAHDGLVDAYNTALLFAKMEKEEELILNSYYQRAVAEESENYSFTFGSLFAGLDLQSLIVA